MKNYFKIALFILFVFTIKTNAQTVSTNAALTTAISNATAGTTIILANGKWNNVQISINKTGTATNPIIIKAETAGSVFLEGNSYIKIGGKYIYIQGFVFQNPSSLSLTPLVEFKASSTNCDYCKLTNVKIDSYNGTSAQETSTFKWILLNGQYNEISYCSFLGKNGVGSIINDNRDASDPDYTKIHHNYFANRTPVGEVNALNDQDAIRIGNSGTSLFDSFTEVYENFFHNFSGEVEVISNKSCNNKYYNNTFRNHQGTLTLRHGNNCEVFGNFFIANNQTFSGGIRVMGENHKIYNNYIEGVNSKKPDNSTSKATGGINVSNGRVDSALNGYYQVKNVTITNNTFVNCDFGFRIGTKVSSDLSLAPENLIIANNIIANPSTNGIQQITAPTGSVSIYQSNIRQGGSWDITTGTNGNTIVNTGLVATTSTDFFRIVSGSAAINAGVGTYSFLTNDIAGGVRPASFDIGAEEFGAAGTRKPYTTSDVGIKVGFYGNTTLGLFSPKVESQNNLSVFPVPANNNFVTIQSKEAVLGLVQIINIEGKKIFETTIDSNEYTFNISKLAKGVYFIKALGASKRFIK